MYAMTKYHPMQFWMWESFRVLPGDVHGSSCDEDEVNKE
jgi:hypothetical protein